MKICITSSGADLSSALDSRFGRCPYFLMVDSESKKVEAVENTGVRARRGAGVTAAQIVADSGCDAVITGNIGPNAFTVLHNTAGIKIYEGHVGKISEENLRLFNNGQLEEISEARPGFGRGPAPARSPSAGSGRGRGRRGGRN